MTMYELTFPTEGYLHECCNGSDDKLNRERGTVPLMTSIDEPDDGMSANGSAVAFVHQRTGEKPVVIGSPSEARIYLQIETWHHIIAKPYDGPTKAHPDMPNVLVKATSPDQARTPTEPAR